MDTVQTERIRNGVVLATAAVYAAGYATNGLVLMLAVAVREMISRTWRWIPTPLDRPLVAYAAIAFISALFSEWRRESLVFSIFLALTMALSVRTVAAYALGGAGRCLRFLTFLVAGGMVTALVAAMQFDPAGIRLPVTTALGSNAVGTTLALAVVIMLGLLTGRAPGPWWALIAVLAVLLFGLLATWARAAWLGAVAGTLVLVAVGVERRVRVALVFLGLFLIVLAAVLLPRWPALDKEVRSIGSLQANKNRITLWMALPKMIAEHPITGTGFGTFVFAYPRYRLPGAFDLNPPFAHNLLLNSLAEMGPGGLAAIVALCAMGLLSPWRWMTRSPRGSPGRTAAVTVLAALIALLASQMADGTLMSVHLSFGLFALLAVGAVGDRYLSKGEALSEGETSSGEA